MDTRYIIEILLGSTGGVLTFALGLFCIVAYSSLIQHKNRKHTYIFWFGLVLIITGLWAILEVWNEQNIFGVYDIAITYGVGTTLPLVFYWFAQSLAGKIIWDGNQVLFLVIQTVVMAYILNPVYGVISYDEGVSALNLGSYAHLVFVLYMLTVSFIGLGKLFKLTKTSKIPYIKSMFFSIIIPFSIVAISNILVPYLLLDNSYHRIGPLSLLIMAIYVTYIIVRQEALEIPVVLFQVYALVTVLIVVILIQIGLMFFGVISIFSPERLILIIILTMIVAVLIKQTLAGFSEQESLVLVHSKLKNLVKSKNQFIQISSHQLRTPITAMRGYLSLLKELNFKEGGNVSTYIGQMNAITQNMSTIIEDVLNANELNTGSLGIRLNNCVDIKTQLERVLDNKIFLFEKSKIIYTYNHIGTNFTIIGDEVKLREVLNNAIDNAIQYCKSKISIKLISTEKDITIEVIDDGIGVTHSEQSLIFQAYQRGDYAKKIRREGTGLGLHLMKLIIKAHQGSVKLISEGRNKGSRLVIELPYNNKLN